MTQRTVLPVNDRKGKRPYLWLLCLPFLWQVAAVPWANGIDYAPLGLPFPMVWQMAGVMFASALFAVIFHLDRRAGVEDEEQEFLLAQTHSKVE